MESGNPKLPIPGPHKSRGHIKDIGIDFLQPQQYYWDAVKSRSHSPSVMKALMLGKTKLPSSKVVKTSKSNISISLDNSSENCNAHLNENAQLKLPARVKQHRTEAIKAFGEPLTKELLRKTAEILKDHPAELSIEINSTVLSDDFKNKKDEYDEDSLGHNSDTGLISSSVSGHAVKRKKGNRRDSCSSESVGSDSSSFGNTRLSNAETTSPTRKKLSRRQVRVKKCRDSDTVKHKSIHRHRHKRMKLAKGHNHTLSSFYPESIFKKYWICAEAVNDPKLRMVVVVHLVRMTTALIKSWCCPRDPEPCVIGESTKFQEKKRRRISTSSGDASDVLAEIPSTIINAKKLVLSNTSEQSTLLSRTTSDKVKPSDEILKSQLFTSDSDNASQIRNFVRAPQAGCKPKRPKRCRSKKPVMFTSSEAMDEIFVDVNKKKQHDLNCKLKDSDSEEEPLFSPKKVKRISSASTVIPSDAPTSEKARPLITALEISNSVSTTAVISHSDDSTVENVHPSSVYQMSQQQGSSHVTMPLPTPSFIRFPYTEDDLKSMHIDTMVCVHLERLVLPFLGNKLYPNVVCYDFATSSRRMPVSRPSSEDGFAIGSACKTTKRVISSPTKEECAAKKCDTLYNQTKKLPGQTRSQVDNNRAAEFNSFPQIKLKQKSGRIRCKHLRIKKSRILLPSSDEDSHSESTVHSTKRNVSLPKTLDVDQICVISEKVSRWSECKALDVLCTAFDELDKPIDCQTGSPGCKLDLPENEKQKSVFNKSKFSKSENVPRNISKKECGTEKHRSREHGSNKDDCNHRVPSASLERMQSAKERTKKESTLRDISRKERVTVRHTSREHSSRIDNKKCFKHSRFSSTSSDKVNLRIEERPKKESKSKKHRHQRRHSDDKRKSDISHRRSFKEIEKRSCSTFSNDKSRSSTGNASLSNTEGDLKLSFGEHFELGKDICFPKEADGSNKERYLKKITMDSVVDDHKGGSDSSSLDLERVYDSLCNIPTELVDGPDLAEVEQIEEDICEDFFLLNQSTSGFSSEQEDSLEINALEVSNRVEIVKDILKLERTSEETVEQEAIEKNLLLETGDENPKQKTLEESQQMQKEGCVSVQQTIEPTLFLSNSNSDVYDPLDDFEPNYQLDFSEDLAGAKSPVSFSLNSTYTAPSPASTVPSPTLTAQSLADSVPSPNSAMLNLVSPAPGSDNGSAPSIIPTGEGHACVTYKTLGLNQALFCHTQQKNVQRLPSVVEVDTMSMDACSQTLVKFELPGFVDQQQSKNFWNMDKMSVVANKSQRAEDDGSGVEVDALSLLAPSMDRDSIFGGEDFEENVPSKDFTSIAAVHSPDTDNEERNEHIQNIRRQPTAIVRPMTFQCPTIAFDGSNEVLLDLDSDHNSEKDKAFMQEISGKSVSELLEELTVAIEKRSIKKAVCLFNFLEMKIVGTLKYNMLDSLLNKTASGGILSPQQLGEVVKIVNKVVPSFCDNLKNQVQIFRKCLKTILVCKRTTSLRLLSLRLTGINSNLGLTKFYNEILLAAINADASEVLHLYKEGQKIGIRLDFVVVRALQVMFRTSSLYSLADDLYKLGCFIGGYSNIMICEWPVCLKLRSYYTEHEIDAIFKDFINKVAVQFKGAFFGNRQDLAQNERHKIFIFIENFLEGDGRNIRYLRDAEPSLEAIHKRICNVLHLNNVTQFNTAKDGRIIEIDSGAVNHLLSRSKSKSLLLLHPTLRRPHWVPSIFHQVFANDYMTNPF